ncbi:MAG: YbaY family lipoprotein [Planctomycetaceae bacterium]|nr:YbaY family lipoprotein [Planctomycetaceae bacterium]
MFTLSAGLAALTFASMSGPAYGVDPRKAPTNPPQTAFVVPGAIPGTPVIPGTATFPGATIAPGTPTLTPAPLVGTRERLGTLTPGAAGTTFVSTPTSPNMPSRGPRWRLGVYSQDTDTGVKILRTVANSPADRAGLEANDFIIAVAGYQVGIVNGQQFDCGYEFEQRADSQGNCMLLVFDNRTRSVVNLPIQLESRLAKVNGTIAYRSRIFLPQNAVAVVELREAQSTGTQGIVLGQQEITDIRQVPIPFEVVFDPLDVNTRRNYVVTATITANGRPLYTTVAQYPVLTNGRPQTASIEVERASADPQTAAVDERDQINQQIINYFRTYFGRDPSPQEMPLWTAQVTERGRSLFDLQADMASNAQVWSRCQNDEARYIEMLHEAIVGKKPTQEELDYWMYQYQKSGGLRRPLAEELLTAAGVPR